MTPTEWQKGDFRITTDRHQMDLAVIHRFLHHQSYWAAGVPLETLKRSMEHSLCFGLLKGETQIGFARVITDFATFAYLADVFVLAEYRGTGLGKWLLEVIVSHPQLQGLRRWLLATRDAHGLYRQYGFQPLARPENFMERHNPNVYGTRSGN